MADKEKRDAAADALLVAIAKQAPNTSQSGVEKLARAYRAVVGGAQPGGGCECGSK